MEPIWKYYFCVIKHADLSQRQVTWGIGSQANTMKIKYLILLTLAVLWFVPLHAQTVVFQFTFENTEVVTVDNAVGTPTFSVFGVNNPNYFSGAALTNCTSSAGNARSYAGWNTGDRYRFTVNTSNYGSLAFLFCARTSNIEVNNFLCRVSTNGTNWVTIIPEFTLTTNFQAFSGSLPSTFEGQPTVYIEIYKTDNPGDNGNNLRIDNATLTSSGPLPIELLSFTGKKADKTVKLHWSTATERQNAWFEVERAEDGIAFSAIGKVKGAGDSQSTLDYELLDAAPKPGTNYYRLKQTDFDGQFTYSPVVTVQFDGPGGFRLFPIPVKDQLSLQLDEPDAFESQWMVYNALGQLVLSGILPEEQSSLDLNVSDLAPGMYWLQRTSGRARSSRMFVKE